MAEFYEDFIMKMFDISKEKFADVPADLVADIASKFLQLPNVWAMIEKSKLKNRLTEQKYLLTEIKTKIDEKENSVYYKQTIFPLIVQKLSKENEDEKITVIIEGFEHVVDEDLYNIEELYHFYDVLDELRYSDMMFFVELYKKKKYVFDKYNGVQTYQRNKLIRLGLIVDNLDLGTFDNESLEEIIEFTKFGHDFYDFFKLEDVAPKK